MSGDRIRSERLLTIGEFAAETRLSSRALRIYDSIGLLCPVEVDDFTGYRRYSPDQISLARRIRLLRGIGMSLAEIEALPGDASAAADDVRQFWQRVERDHAARRILFGHIQATLRGEPQTMYDVSTREVPEQKVLSMTRRVTVADLSAFIGEAMTMMFDHVKETGVTSDQPPFVVFHGHVDEDSDGPVEVCVPFDGSAEPVGAMAVRIEPGHEVAFTRLTKDQMQFPGVLSAYDAVHDWVHAQPGLEQCAPPREVYFADWPTATGADEVCDIAWPFCSSE
jgi:DNA-binding transcriptional MerR regulator